MTLPNCLTRTFVSPEPRCPNCGSQAVSESMETSTFEYGTPLSVPITVTEPVMRCAACSEAWTDYRGEEARQAAIDQYRVVLSLPVAQALLEALRHAPAFDAVLKWTDSRRTPYADTAYDLISGILKTVAEQTRQRSIVALATQVLKDQANNWFTAPCSALNDELPSSVMGYSPERVEAVLRELQKG